MTEVAKKRSMTRDLLELLRDNPMLTDKECATLLAMSERTVFILRQSDSFRAALALMIDKVHGEALRSVRNNTILAVNDALEMVRRGLNDVALMPSIKMELGKMALDHYNKGEDREARKHVPQPIAQPGNSVNVTISLTDLQEARQAAITHGAAIELEPSDSTHSAGLLQQRGLLGSREESRPPLRSEGRKSFVDVVPEGS